MKITCNYKEFATLIRWCETRRIAGECEDCPFKIYCMFREGGCEGHIPSIDTSDVNFCIL